MAKYLTENKIRKLAIKRVDPQGTTAFARAHSINANQLSNYLNGYLLRCPPALQKALGIKRVTVYMELDHPDD